MKKYTLACICLCMVLFSKAQQNRLPKLELAPFAEGFDAPMDMAHGNDSRLFVAERLGKIWVIDADGNKIGSTPFLDITDRVFTVYPNDYDERGLLGIAFHPNYPDSPYIYVNYTGLDSNSYVSRFTTDPNDPNKAMANSELNMLKVNQPRDPKFLNHKAGCLKFGPDGYLYGTFGDGGWFGDPRNNAQDLSKLLGKMFRIDVNMPDMERGKNYSIPPTNPYVGKDGIKPEIWASGLRNPFRFSFDKMTGDLWLPDVGQDKWEEINFEVAGSKGGKNYGWSCYEGNHNYKINISCDYNGVPYTFPIVEYKHSANNCAAITGGFVYRGSKYPKMYGMYIYNDYCTGKYSVVFKMNQSWVNIFLLDEEDGEYTSFAEDVNGELYSIDETTGEIERVIDASQKSGVNSSPALANVDVKLSPNPNNGQFTVELTSSKQGKYSIIITDLAGSTILSENRIANAGVNRWSLSSPRFRTGTYMLHIQSESTSISKTFVVEK